MRLSIQFRGALASACLALTVAPLALAQQPRGGLREPVYRVAQQPQRNQPASQPAAQVDELQARPGEHPLMPSIRKAKAMLEHIDRDIKDYTCTLVKRERVNGELLPHEYIFTKVRHQPFSVYLYFLGPEKLKGTETLYVNGHNDGKLVAHAGSGAERLIGTIKLDPTGRIAMRGNRYPITEIGIRTLTQRLIEVGTQDSKFGECEVKHFRGAKINGRVCTCLQVVHPVPRENFRFHMARIFIDDEYNVPVRFESYAWPTEQGGKPVLLEEYTYMNLKLNVGLTDADFDQRNNNYQF